MKMEAKNRFTPMKQGVIQDKSMEIHVASMSNDVEQQNHEENNKKLEEK